ncbi:MAG: type III PLP-dependent enzyme [Planktotalea sp.]|uniref:type III PLP-dependent enzyme n=1 Tax=Planktotalea sp. TaxID=2029877 RepID=UPI003C75D56C
MTMKATDPGAFRAQTPVLFDRASDFIARNVFERPTLVLDLARVEVQYDALKAGLGDASIHYAVKANPDARIIAALLAKGSHFDCASRAEIELCLSQGARADQISFGNTIKRATDIAFAASKGISLLAADAPEELEKIAAHAPDARVYLRVIVENSQADWPLSRKFGAAGGHVLSLLEQGRALGLSMVGLSFHVGSQTRKSVYWGPVLDQIAKVWENAQQAGFELGLLNIGGGFPAFYGEAVDAPTNYAADVIRQVRARFGDVQIIAEPGRGMVAEAGHIVAEVLLVARKSPLDAHRWVFLDIGKFSGLAETMDEAIRYEFVTAKDGSDTGPCILAGPSCDSADVLYEKTPVQLPKSLASGDRIIVRNCGAYTTTYASIGFNGFPPLDVVVL